MSKFDNREKYMLYASLIYMVLAIANMWLDDALMFLPGLLFIVMLALPFVNKRLADIVFKQ